MGLAPADSEDVSRCGRQRELAAVLRPLETFGAETIRQFESRRCRFRLYRFQRCDFRTWNPDGVGPARIQIGQQQEHVVVMPTHRS